MNKKFLSAILFGALVASAGSFVSCADNDSKIDQLQNQNDQLKAELAKIQAELKAELQTANASQAAAIEAKLSAIENATAQNLAATVAALKGDFDTQESRVVALETQIKALEAIQNEDAAAIIEALNKAKERDNADFEKLSEMVNALDADVNVLISEVRALVFQPEFYLDGIEAAEYTYLHYVALNSTSDVYKKEGKNYDGNPVTIADGFAWGYAHCGNIDYPEIGESWSTNGINVPTSETTESWGYGLSKETGVDVPNTVKFAVNPSNAKLNLNMVIKNICAMTRAEVADVIYAKEIARENGIVTVQYEIKNPLALITANNKETNPGDIFDKNKVNTSVFKLIANADEAQTVESDWGVLYETAVQPIAIAKKSSSAWNVSNTCNKTELYKNPYEALAALPTFKLGYKDEAGVDMAKKIELHFVKRDLEKPGKTTTHYSVSLEDAAKYYGMTYKFIPVPYTAAGNKTIPTNYSTLTDESGVANVKANIVDETTGLAKAEQGESSVGKQPLYQILVYKGEDVVLDAYVKIIITRSVAPIVTDELPLAAQSYDCKGLDYATTWYQFSTIVLQYGMEKANGKGMEIEEFDAKYDLEKDAAGNAKLYSTAGTKEAPAGVAKTDLYTSVKYVTDPKETVNHVFKFNLDECAQQYIIEDKGGKDTFYVKFISKDDKYIHDGYDMAIDPEVFVPITFSVTDKNTTLTYSEKNPNVWYAADGTPDKSKNEAIRFNVVAPYYEEGITNTKNFVADLNDYWMGKKVNFFEGETAYTQGQDNKKAYYFHPLTNIVEVVDEYDGTVYELHVESNELLCHKWNKGSVLNDHCDEATTHTEIITMKNTDDINEIVKTHKVYVGYGVYLNDELQAKVKGTNDSYETIAILDQETGKIKYDNDSEMAKKVLNAWKHSEATQKAYVGLVRTDDCDHAVAIADGVFPAFFLRPLDVTIADNGKVIDADPAHHEVNIFSLFTFEDWRDVKFYDVENNDFSNINLVAYYGINKITVDLTKVMTNFGKEDPEAKCDLVLTDVNKDVKLSFCDADGNVKANLGEKGSIEKNLSAYNVPNKYGKSAYNDFCETFGKIKYNNKLTGVSDFVVEIPVSISYDWGTITKKLTVYVEGTKANNK